MSAGRLLAWVVVGGMLVFVGATRGHTDAGGAELPPARGVPGVSSADLHPHGCVDCHVQIPEMNVDARFGTLMAKLEQEVEPKLLEMARASSPEGVAIRGRHPPVPGALKDIPTSCNPCHAADSRTAPPFARLLHRIHLSSDPRNVFMTVYQGECTHCHKLDGVSGVFSMPAGPER